MTRFDQAKCLSCCRGLSLSRISLDAADPGSGSTQQAVAVEKCECPWGYNGTSCEVRAASGTSQIFLLLDSQIKCNRV